MANVTDASVIKFCNEYIRPSADDAAHAYYKAKALVDRWNALNLSSQILNDPGTIIEDGSPADGRPPLTGLQVYGMIAMAQGVIANWEANGGQVLEVVLSVAVNPNITGK